MFLRNRFQQGIGILCLLVTSAAFAADGNSPETVTGAVTVNAAEAKALWKEGATFIDTRKNSDWEAGRVPGALHINIKEPEFSKDHILSLVEANHPVISYCNAEKCHRAANGAKKLISYGFTKVYYFRDGFPSWKNAGYPYE